LLAFTAPLIPIFKKEYYLRPSRFPRALMRAPARASQHEPTRAGRPDRKRRMVALPRKRGEGGRGRPRVEELRGSDKKSFLFWSQIYLVQALIFEHLLFLKKVFIWKRKNNDPSKYLHINICTLIFAH